MKKFVKMISTVTVMCLLMASLAACGKKDSGKDTSCLLYTSLCRYIFHPR